MTDIKNLRRILTDYKRVAIVGLSDDWSRPSNFAAKYLLDHGFEVIPVNPKYDAILGQKCYADLRDIPGPVDIVDLFQRVERIPPFVDQAIEIGASVVWLQLGIVHEEAAQKARVAGLEVVMDRCMKIEYARLFGGLNTIGVRRNAPGCLTANGASYGRSKIWYRNPLSARGPNPRPDNRCARGADIPDYILCLRRRRACRQPVQSADFRQYLRSPSVPAWRRR
jgi:predicted CoA-binding protein